MALMWTKTGVTQFNVLPGALEDLRAAHDSLREPRRWLLAIAVAALPDRAIAGLRCPAKERAPPDAGTARREQGARLVHARRRSFDFSAPDVRFRAVRGRAALAEEPRPAGGCAARVLRLARDRSALRRWCSAPTRAQGGPPFARHALEGCVHPAHRAWQTMNSLSASPYVSATPSPSSRRFVASVAGTQLSHQQELFLRPRVFSLRQFRL